MTETPTTPKKGEPLNGESVRLLMPGDEAMTPHGPDYVASVDKGEVWFAVGTAHCGYAPELVSFIARPSAAGGDREKVARIVCPEAFTSWEGYPIGQKDAFEKADAILSFVSRPTAQADKTAPAFDWTAATNAAWAENNPTPSAPSRMASDAPAEGAGELPNKHVVDHPDAYLNALLDYTKGFYHATREAGLSAKVCADAMQHVESAARGLHRKALAALTQTAPADPVADMSPEQGMWWFERTGMTPREILASLSPSPGVTDKLVEALEMAWERLSVQAQIKSKTSECEYLRGSMATVAGDLRQALTAARQAEASA